MGGLMSSMLHEFDTWIIVCYMDFWNVLSESNNLSPVDEPFSELMPLDRMIRLRSMSLVSVGLETTEVISLSFLPTTSSSVAQDEAKLALRDDSEGMYSSEEAGVVSVMAWMVSLACSNNVAYSRTWWFKSATLPSYVYCVDSIDEIRECISSFWTRIWQKYRVNGFVYLENPFFWVLSSICNKPVKDRLEIAELAAWYHCQVFFAMKQLFPEEFANWHWLLA